MFLFCRRGDDPSEKVRWLNCSFLNFETLCRVSSVLICFLSFLQLIGWTAQVAVCRPVCVRVRSKRQIYLILQGVFQFEKMYHISRQYIIDSILFFLFLFPSLFHCYCLSFCWSFSFLYVFLYFFFPFFFISFLLSVFILLFLSFFLPCCRRKKAALQAWHPLEARKSRRRRFSSALWVLRVWASASPVVQPRNLASTSVMSSRAPFLQKLDLRWSSK